MSNCVSSCISCMFRLLIIANNRTLERLHQDHSEGEDRRYKFKLSLTSADSVVSYIKYADLRRPRRRRLCHDHEWRVKEATTAAATKRLLQNRTFRSVKCFVFFMCEEGKMIFHLLGTNGFLLKVENERFTAAFSKKTRFYHFRFKSHNCPWLPHCPGNMLRACVR